MWPGVKASACAATLPVSVAVTPLASTTTPAIESVLDQHMFLLYTGKTRLAKNLLQRVLRQWALRENDVTQLVASLRHNAVNMAAAIKNGDVAAVGHALSTYWEQKKLMAPMAEPAEATAILAALREHVHGASLCGAGGGGFMVVISKLPNNAAAIERVLREHPDTGTLVWSLHGCTVNTKGLEVLVQH